MIQGYPDRPSVSPGEALTLHISTDAPQFRVDFYRQGQALVFTRSSDWLPGQNLPSTFPAVRWDQDWGWPSYTFAIPPDWPSGAYIAMLREGDCNGHILKDANGNDIVPDQGLDTSYGQWGKVLFVVKSAAHGQATSILYKLSWATYHAYNWAGSGSLYRNQDHPGVRDSQFLMKVTTHRPGGGTGGDIEPDPTGPPPYYWNPSTPNNSTFTQYDPAFIGWLEANGYQVEYCTDLDIHEDTDLALLGSYNLLLSVGHDEYWSPEMRTHVETFRDKGGNVAFFSGNTCWWRIHFVDNDNAGHPTAIICDKNWGYDPQWPITGGYNGHYHLDQWYALDFPNIRTGAENSLTGVSYRNGGGYAGQNNPEPRPPLGYTVQHAVHWVYDRTGLHDGDVFGDNERLIGYECDGAFFDPNQHDSQGYLFPTGTDGTPPNFVILGIAEIPHEWNAKEGRESYNDTITMTHAATVGLYNSPGGGTVFTGATTDWALALGRIHEPHVEQITRNVLSFLGSFLFGVWQINANGYEGQLKIQFLDSSAGVVHIQGTVAFTDQPGVVDTILGTWDNAAKRVTFTRGPDNPVSQTYIGFLGDNHPERELILAGWFTESDIPATAPRSTFGWFAEKSRA